MLTGSTLDPAPVMLATSRAVLLDHREITAVLATSIAFLGGVLAMAWMAV